MDVYLLPVAAERYELYCEVPDEPHEPAHGQPQGFFRRMKQQFAEMLSEAERERRQGRAERGHQGWWTRVKAQTLRWVAESIAEQRLLWHLRRQDDACLLYPDDLEERQATAVLRRQLGRDFDKHRFWLVIDSLGFAASGLLFFVPGPNVIAYYFAFRMVGHFFSWRGARHGLAGVRWTSQRSTPLSDLRRAIGLDAEERERRVHEVADALKLEHLAKFFERIAIRAS